MKRYTSREKEIAQGFGLKPYQLHVLLRIHRGDKISGNNTGSVLDRLGYTAITRHDGSRLTTDKGCAVMLAARKMGF